MRRKAIVISAVAASAAVTATALVAGTAVATTEPDGRAENVRVMEYNINHGYNWDHDWDDHKPTLDSTAEAIRNVDPDILAVQEITEHHDVGEKEDQPEILGEMIDMEPVFKDNRPEDDPQRGGNAIFSKYPVVDDGHISLSRDDDIEGAYRGLMWATLDVNGTEVRVYNTHLVHTNTDKARDMRETQTREIIEEIGSVADTPTLLLGDLNEEPENDKTQPTPADLLVNHGFADAWHAVGDGDGATIPVNPNQDPDRRYDYVLASPHFEFLHTVVQREYASDHYPVDSGVRLHPDN